VDDNNATISATDALDALQKLKHCWLTDKLKLSLTQMKAD